MYCYSVFGVILESAFSIPGLDYFSQKKFDGLGRIFFCRKNFRISTSLEGWVSSGGLVYWSSPRQPYIFVRHPMGDFRIDCVRRIIDWKPRSKSNLNSAQLLSGSRIIGLLLPHVNPVLSLHASALTMRGEAVCFLGASGRGKSTLAMSFLNHRFPLLSDDLAVIQNLGDRLFLQPGPRDIRLWPKVVKRFNPNGKIEGEVIYPELKKQRFPVGPETPWGFAEKPAPLGALYILSRRPKTRIKIKSLEGREALLAILRNAYNRIVEPPKILRQQFEIATQVTQKVPVKRLIYPTGFSHLSQVRKAILEDLKS